MANQDLSEEDMAAVEKLFAAYGADLSKWPAEVRARYGNIALSEAFQPLHNDAAMIDAILADAPPARSPHELNERLLAAFDQRQQKPVHGFVETLKVFFSTRGLVPFGAAAAIAVVGFFTGLFYSDPLTPEAEAYAYLVDADGDYLSWHSGGDAMSRGLIIALVLSAALNVFFIGHVTGRAFSPHHGSGHWGGPPRSLDTTFGVMRHTEGLPPEVREKFRDQIRAHLPEMREHFQQRRREHDELHALLIADEWNPDAVLQKLNEIDGARSEQRAKMSEAFVSAFGELTPEQRKMLVEKAKEHRKGRRERSRRHRSERTK